MRRRKFIQISGLTSAAALASPAFLLSNCSHDMDDMMDMGGNVWVKEGNFDALLPLPDNTGVSTELIAKSSSFDILKGKTTQTLTYGDGILGPAIRAVKGDVVSIRVQNNLSEETNIHWHGLIVPATMDGHPQDLITPVSSFHYNFTVEQRAGTYWYHPHPHAKTARQVFMGLAGLFIVTDEEEEALHLPSGDYEVPLIIQDKRMSGDVLVYAPTMNEIMTGYLGERVLVNGVCTPFLNVATRWYRFRVLNGSTARLYNLSLSNRADFYVIGSDGGLSPSPEKAKELLLSPGERADLLMDFSKMSVGDEIYLQNSSFDGGVQGRQAFSIMKFIAERAETDSFTLPSALSSIVPLSAASAARTRTFDIAGMEMGDGHGGHGSGGMMEGMHTINGKIFAMDRVDEMIEAGATEIWEFDNSMGDEIHPMHVHSVQFQVLERVGGRNRLIPLERGWKDTVLTMPGEKVRVIMSFPQHKGRFVLHCHNLEHEDDGMMLNFEII